MKKEWHQGFEPLGKPFGKYALEYNCQCGLECLSNGYAWQKCTCGKTHRVHYTSYSDSAHGKKWHISPKG